jgi:hypothetical protein
LRNLHYIRNELITYHQTLSIVNKSLLSVPAIGATIRNF